MQIFLEKWIRLNILKKISTLDVLLERNLKLISFMS